MKHEKGTNEETDSFDDQLDTPDDVKDSSDEDVESINEEEDTSDEDYELELKKKSNSKVYALTGSKEKSDRRYEKTQIGRERALSISLAMKNLVMLTQKGVMENQSDVQNHLVEIQADDHDLLVNSDNKNDDMLGYESKNYFDAKDAVGTNHSDRKLVKRGITRLYKFRREYGKLGGIKIKRYFNVDLTVKKLVMHRLGQLLTNFRMKLREKYILPNLNTPLKLNELPAKYSAIVKVEEWVEFVNYTTTYTYKEKSTRGKMACFENVYHHKLRRGGYVFVKEKMYNVVEKKGKQRRRISDDEITLVGDKLVKADDKIKEGTLNLDDGTDAMTVVFGKKKRGYARGVGSGVTYKRHFDLPRSRQATDERIELLQTQLDNERSERQQKDVTPMAINNIDSIAYEVDKTQSSLVVRDKYARNQKKSNGLVTLKKGNGNNGNNGLKTVKDVVGGFFAWPKNQVVLDEEALAEFEYC
nr:hypothetical protein [Tanacetum cinerariifolium]